MIRPRFFAYLLFLLIVWLASHFGTWVWVRLLLIFLLLLPLFSLFTLLLKRPFIRFRSDSGETMVERGSQAVWHFRIEDKLPFDLLYIEALSQVHRNLPVEHLAPFPLHGREELHLSIDMPALHCGPLRPLSFAMRIEDRFGFFRLPLRRITAEAFAPVLVLPRSLITIIDKEESDTQLEAGERMSHKSEHELDEIDRIRKMVAGDRFRSIHWKLSARMRTWMVRQFEKADENQVDIRLDFPPLDLSSPQSEEVLALRDVVLDQVSEAMHALLNQRFSVALKVDTPWPRVIEASLLSEYNVLRIELAQLPCQGGRPLVEQLSDELTQAGSHFYLLFTSDLSAELCAQVLLLAQKAQGIMLRLTSPKNRVPAAWKERMERLTAAGVRVHLGRPVIRRN